MPVNIADEFGNSVSVSLGYEIEAAVSLRVADLGTVSLQTTAYNPLRKRTFAMAGVAASALSAQMQKFQSFSSAGTAAASWIKRFVAKRTLSADGLGAASFSRAVLNKRVASAAGVGAANFLRSALFKRTTAIAGIAAASFTGVITQPPQLDLNFASGTYVDNASNTTLATIATFARSSSATYVDSSGVVQTASSGTIRDAHHEWNGSAWVRKGLLLETDAATNLLLNSGTLSTQSVTTSAQPYTLHFTGTGTVTLSGTSTAGPLVGTGTGENNRVSLTFTPTAGTLTLTVSGTVSNAQLEAGDFPSSYIPTSGATATRAGETLSVNAAGVPWSTTAMSWVFEGELDITGVVEHGLFGYRVSSGTELHTFVRGSSNPGRLRFISGDSGTSFDDSSSNYSSGYRQGVKAGFRLTTSEIQSVQSGVGGTANSNATSSIYDYGASSLPLYIGIRNSQGYPYNGTISRLRMWDSDIGASELETETT